MAQSLPTEINTHIFQYLPSQDFVRLARVSRSFLQEVDRLLYCDVVLIHFKALKCWCRTIIAHPDLGLRTHCLTIHLPPSSIFDAQHQINLSRALKECPNIKDLRILRVESSRSLGNETTGTSFLQNCSFRLKKFTNWYFLPSVLFDFLASQPQITFLSMSTTKPWSLPGDILPSLVDLEVGGCIDISATSHRRIAHLCIIDSPYYSDDKEIFHAFEILSPTLTSLTVVKSSRLLDSSWNTVQMVLQGSQYTHQLKYLNITHDFWSESWEALLEALSKTTKLECLVLVTNRNVSSQHLQERMFLACPTLRRLVLVDDDGNHCFGRSPEGSLQFEGLIDSDEVDWTKVY